MRLILALAALAIGPILANCAQTEVEYVPCPEGKDCIGGEFLPDPQSDDGLTGSACEFNDDCDANFCVTIPLLEAMGADTTDLDVPGGMCAQFPCQEDLDCGDVGVCTPLVQFTANEDKICLLPCAHLAECRWQEGYSCMFPFTEQPDFGVCLPDSLIAKTYCPGGVCVE